MTNRADLLTDSRWPIRAALIAVMNVRVVENTAHFYPQCEFYKNCRRSSVIGADKIAVTGRNTLRRNSPVTHCDR